MRLIDADALKLYIDKEVEEDKVLDGWAFFFKVYLDNAPSIDIVRCGECKYNKTWKCPLQYNFLWRDTPSPHYPGANDYCSYGERSSE